MFGLAHSAIDENIKFDKDGTAEDVSNFCTVVVKDLHSNQTHHLHDTNMSTHFHDLLINYCRTHQMDMKNFVFLIPSDGLISRNISWKVATPSMRIKDCISEALLDITERRICIQCVPKKNVPRYVIWNNCDSTKYAKVLKDVGKCNIHPPIPVPQVRAFCDFGIS